MIVRTANCLASELLRLLHTVVGGGHIAVQLAVERRRHVRRRPMVVVSAVRLVTVVMLGGRLVPMVSFVMMPMMAVMSNARIRWRVCWHVTRC